MKRSLKLLALLAALMLVLAACGGDDDAGTTTTVDAGDDDTTTTEEMDEETTTTEMVDEETTTTAGAEPGGALTIATLLPVTGSLAFLGPPEVAGARLAVDDINAAGGVNDEDVVLIEGDSGDDTQDIANPETDRLLASGANVIVGAASSAVSKLVIDKIVGAEVIMFSPANTSPDFTVYDDNGLYFRTAPSDVLQGKVLADQIAAEGGQTVAVLYRQESYGQGLAESFRENFEAAGGTAEPYIAYATDTENFDPEVDQIVEAAPDAVVVIGFAESANILTTMHERGIGPTSDVAVWGVDGNIGGIGGEMSDPSILAGMKGTEPSVDLGTISDFTDRLDGAYEGGVDGVFAYGAETYDAVIISALAAEIAGSNDPVAVAAEINDVTRAPGTVCTSFEECKALIGDGEEIDYVGIGGPYEFIDEGEPAAASFRIATYDGEYVADPDDEEAVPGSTPNPELDEFVFAS